MPTPKPLDRTAKVSTRRVQLEQARPPRSREPFKAYARFSSRVKEGRTEAKRRKARVDQMMRSARMMRAVRNRHQDA